MSRLDKQRLGSAAKERVSDSLARVTHSPRSLRDAKRNLLWWTWARRDAAAARSPRLMLGQGLWFSANGYVELAPVEAPLAGKGLVTVRTDFSAVNVGTERAQYLNLPNAVTGDSAKPGNSLAGTVVAVGSGVDGVRVGDRVAVTDQPHASVVSATPEQVYPLPEGVRPEDAALIKLAVIAAQGVRLAREGTDPFPAFGMVGAGIIGALALRIAVAEGGVAEAVVATSRAKEKLARDGGARSFLTVSEDAGAINALNLPVVFEVSGNPQALKTAIEMAASGGRIVLLGSNRGVTDGVPIDEIRRKGLTLIGAHVDTLRMEEDRGTPGARRREGERFLGLLADGRLSVADLYEEVADPREAAVLYRKIARGSSITGAGLDWSRIPAEERAREITALRPPEVTGRGVDYDGPALHRRPGLTAAALPSPFEGAVGDLRVGMLGCGDISAANAAGVAAAPNARLTACFDPVAALADDLAAQHGAQAVSSAEALVAHPEVDAVFISVPHHLHEPLAQLAFDAGKHVVMEKPLANNLASAHRIVRGAEAAGVTLSVCFPQRYDARVMIARDLISRGALGDFGGSLVKVYLDKSPAYWIGGYSGRTQSTWRSSREAAGGGVLIMNVCHYIDVVRYLAGVEVRSVSSLAAAVDDDVEVEDSISVAMGYANGAVGTIVGNSAVRGATFNEVGVWGRDGHLLLEPRGRVYTLRHIDGVATARWQDFDPSSPVAMRGAYVSRLASAIERGDTPDVTGQDGLAVQAIIEAAYRSADEGRALEPARLIEELDR
jgi:predicted dehydrogenase